MPRFILVLLLALFFTLPTTGCQKESEPPQPAATSAPPPNTGTPPYAENTNQPPPPAPPIKEDFEGEPKLSLFARVGDFAPEEDEKEKLGYWVTFIDHLLRTSGPVKREQGKAFAFRGIKTINSLGFFTPLAVDPDREYRVSYRVWCKLPKGASTGIGFMEYNQFLWVGEQYSKSISQKYFLNAREGVRLSGKQEGQPQQFTFRSGPETRMIHLVFFLEGETDREPVVIDDIEIAPVSPR